MQKSQRSTRRNVGPTIVLDPLDYLDCDPLQLVRRDCPEIEGFGLFADKEFKKDEFLINYRGKHSLTHPNVGTYVFAVQKPKRFVDATEEDSGLARYINDKDPFHPVNCKAVTTNTLLEAPLDITIAFFAVRDIQKGKNSPALILIYL